MVALVFMIIAIVGAIALVSFGIYKSIKLIKSPTPKANNYPLEVKRLIYYSIATSIATLLIFVLLSIYQKYQMNAGEWIELIIGSILFGSSFSFGIDAFIIHYYGKEVPLKLNKWLFYSVIICLVISILGLILLTNGIADQVPYPLVNGLSFSSGFTRPGGIKPSIAWYALCILSGAVLVYFICDHRFYVEYGKHGILESTFLVAFPAGIIGARIGYVIGNWNVVSEGGRSFAQRVAQGEWWSPIAIWEGGLTILSGALVGIIVGVLWFIWRNKKYNIWLAIDIIVPTILIAQGIGRWGNFFNAEVHGLQVDRSYFWFLPKMVTNNMQFSEKYGFASPGNIYMPLFFIEFLTNFIGYFFIRFALGKGLKKYLELGDLAFTYIIWYGLTRAVMEPLRDGNYNMGTDKYWSWFWSLVFVLVGSLLIFANHFIRYLINRKKIAFKECNTLYSGLTCGTLTLITLLFIIFGAINMGTGAMSQEISYNQFNIGLILLIVGFMFMFISLCSYLYLYQGIKRKHEIL